ncbi:hypothetical protein L1D14_04210 [Vibrio tubiashii]|uniref:hypothetical protein n=1 Tax=Vibrio tubiashii TaxID=29498 RepID=UPI001EFC927D|nr:hypothetical protein [Vibrio tubiashii]MCG9575435.1 hypothetical protein [Vibrio tubiashii]
MDIKLVDNIDPEYFPCCPYCDSPIFANGQVVRHKLSDQLALACADCASEPAEQDNN